jgi:chromosome segregation ATPase
MAQEGEQQMNDNDLFSPPFNELGNTINSIDAKVKQVIDQRNKNKGVLLNSLQSVQQKINALVEVLKNVKNNSAELASTKAELSRVQSELNKAVDEKRSSEETILGLNKNIEELNKQINELNRNLELRNNENNQLKQDTVKIRQQLQQKQDELTEKQNELASVLQNQGKFSEKIKRINEKLIEQVNKITQLGNDNPNDQIMTTISTIGSSLQKIIDDANSNNSTSNTASIRGGKRKTKKRVLKKSGKSRRNRKIKHQRGGYVYPHDKDLDKSSSVVSVGTNSYSSKKSKRK